MRWREFAILAGLLAACPSALGGPFELIVDDPLTSPRPVAGEAAKASTQGEFTDEGWRATGQDGRLVIELAGPQGFEGALQVDVAGLRWGEANGSAGDDTKIHFINMFSNPNGDHHYEDGGSERDSLWTLRAGADDGGRPRYGDAFKLLYASRGAKRTVGSDYHEVVRPAPAGWSWDSDADGRHTFLVTWSRGLGKIGVSVDGATFYEEDWGDQRTPLKYIWLGRSRDFAALVGPRFANLKVWRGGDETELVRRWDAFEASFVKDLELDNEFADVDLTVAYTGPAGGRVESPGFYQGKGIWRFRFMPDRPGVWSYKSVFSNGVEGPSGSFECVPSKIPGMISQFEGNPIWFGYAGGGHELIRGLHVGDRFFASRDNAQTGETWDRWRRDAFLDWAQAQGYNTLSIAGHLMRREEAGRGSGWNIPELWEGDRPNPEEFDRMERILDDLRDRGIIVYPFAGFFGRSAARPETPEQQELFLEYAVARLASYWNVMFSVGGPEPRLRGRTYLEVDEIHRLGRTVDRLDPFEHLLSVHNPTGDDEFKDAPWLTYGTLQGPKTLDRRELAAGLLRNHHPEKPLLAQETLWSGNQSHMRSTGGGYSDADLRKNAYVITMCAASLIFADNDGDSSSGFSGTMELADRRQDRHDIIKRVWDFFEGVPLGRMKPRPDLIASAEGANAFCLADPRRDYLFYLDGPGSLSADLEGGPYHAYWIDPQDAGDRRALGVVDAVRNLATPEGGDDWLLRLTTDPAGDAPTAADSYPE